LAGLLLAGFLAGRWSTNAPGQPVHHKRWSIKTSIPDNTDLQHPKPLAFADLIALPNAPGVSNSDSRYDSARIPAFPNSLNVKEGDLVSVKAWLQILASEDDKDYHIQLSARRDDGNQCLIVEVPKPELAQASPPEVRAGYEKIRHWARARLLHDENKEPSGGGNCMKHPPFVEVTGQLFFDDLHVGANPHGKRKQLAATLWELHPVVEMRFTKQPPGEHPLPPPCKN
jgi:hypothetical protein